MTEKEVGELYIRLAFQYESAIGRLLDKKIIDQGLVDRHRKSFYDSLDEEKLRLLQNGILLNGSAQPTLPCQVTVTGTSVLSEILPALHPELRKSFGQNRPCHPVVMGRITITEGRKRQIRRMMKAVHCCVVALKRISMEDIVLDKNLKPGEWKEFFP